MPAVAMPHQIAVRRARRRSDAQRRSQRSSLGTVRSRVAVQLVDCASNGPSSDRRLVDRSPRTVRETKNFRPDVLGDHAAEQREGVGVVDRDVEQLADLAAIAVEDHDPVAVRAADQLHDRSPPSSCRWRGLARPFDQHFHLAADERLVVFLADRVLDRQQLVVATASSPPRARRRETVATLLVPGRSLYLKMKLFLNRDSRTRSTVCCKILLGLAAKADDEIAGHRRVGNRRANARQHLAIFFDRVAALHPLAARAFEPLWAGTCR